MADPIELPDELRQPAQPSEEDLAQQYQRLQKIGVVVAAKRDDAVKARKESGIEDVWTYCEEAYASIDDLNRSSGNEQQWRKPTSPSGPLTKTAGEPENRSTVFVPLTRRYVDMGAAKIKEKALPIDDKPFSMKPSAEADLVTPLPPQAAAPVAPAQPPAMAAAPGAVGAQPAPNPASAVPATPTPAADAAQTLAKSAAEKASDRIYDWLSEAKYANQLGRVIDDGARVGVGILKGPFPDSRTERAYSRAKGLEMVQRTAPGVTWIDFWNFFPARNCGEDIHDGDMCAERSFLAEGKLRDLKNLKEPGGLSIYLAEQIDKVITEGPEKVNQKDNGRRDQQDKKGLYTVWDIFCEMSRADMIALGAVGAEDLPEEVLHCYAIVTLVNDTVIRAQFNPLSKSGNFPYRVFCWSRRVGLWAGVGVGEQVAVPQKQVNAGTRAWMNNAGVSSGVQLLLDESKIYPIDGSMVIGGGIKLWGATPEASGTDMRTAMAAIEIPNLGDELKAIVDYAFRMAEEMSNIPLVSQGQTGPQDPQTFGQAELLNSNGNTLLRQISDYLDGYVIEPMVGDLYEWLLLDDEVPDDEKGDFEIVAQGCAAMVEKAIQEQTLVMLGSMTLNPAYGMSPSRWAEEFARSKRLDPERLKYTDQERQQMLGAAPPKSPQEKVAEINAAAKLHGIDMVNQAHLQEIAQDAQRERQDMLTGGVTPHAARAMAMVDTAHIRAVSAENIEASRAFAERERAQKELEIAQQNGQFKLAEMNLQKEIALLDYANQQKISLDQVRAQLATAAMNNQTKKELASAELQLAQNEGAQNRAVDLHKHHNPPPSLQRDEVATPVTP